MNKGELSSKHDKIAEEDIKTLDPIPHKLTIVCAFVLGVLLFLLIFLLVTFPSPENDDNFFIFILKTMNII